MKRTQLNFIIDVVAFMLFAVMTTTGLVMRWMLPAGSGRIGSPGRGRYREVLALWGLDRHQWGNLHFWLAVGLLAVLAVHLLLHGRWLIATVRGRSSDASGQRFVVGAFALFALLALAAAPLLSTVETVQP